MRQLKELWLPFLVLALPCLAFTALLPYFPVDETRYLSVAWEMRLYDSFLVPLQNGLPYSHKPPLMFWLINLDWLVFGVNEWSLRLIPLAFSLGNVALLHRLALLLWDDERVARYAALILASLFSYSLWSALIMFDVVLTFWVLLGLLGLVSASRSDSLRPWLLTGTAIGGGLLTKGPVVLVYLLPAALLSFLWLPERRGVRWYGRLALSLALGIALLLLWLVPAVLTGGESYRQAILWGQTVNRMANSFAHQRPFWWYLPWLPALLLPWVLVPAAWRRSAWLAGDAGTRFALVCGVSTLAIFSLLSGKQVHYLIPALPAFSLLMARSLASGAAADLSPPSRYAVASVYSLLGVAALALPFTKPGRKLELAGFSGLPALALGLLAIGAALMLLQHRSPSRLVSGAALATTALAALLFCTGQPFFQRYELHDISEVIRQKQEEGYSVLHQDKYHGQYQFMGRLRQPLLLVPGLDEIARYAAGHDKVALITYEAQSTTVAPDCAYFQRPYRSKKVVLWNRKGIAELLKRHGVPQPAPNDAI